MNISYKKFIIDISYYWKDTPYNHIGVDRWANFTVYNFYVWKFGIIVIRNH
jgi:hypothetical protein